MNRRRIASGDGRASVAGMVGMVQDDETPFFVRSGI